MLKGMNRDRIIDDYASRQYGTFSRGQAEKAGFTARMMSTRVENGAWIRLAPAVYALASAPPKWERQVAAALLSREGSIVAGRSAACIHGFPGFGQGRPVLMICPGGNARSPIARIIRSDRFHNVGRVRKMGFVVTDEAETVMTLAAEIDHDRMEALVDFLLARKSCTVEELARVVAANDGARGIGRLRPIVEYRLPDVYQPPTSELERLMYPILDDPRLPPYTRQVPMRYEKVDATVDAYIDQWRLIVEGDGRRWHTRRADMERDRIRDNEAVAHGIVVLRFTYEMLRDHPEKVIDTLLRAGRMRQAS
jgi:very-short-patch-repair endonuclease